MSVGRLAATLCPQAEGDAGQRAVTTSLFRLRKLIGNDAVRRHGGRISLDPECCWVDCWELERLLNTQAQERSFHFARILSLYHRPFLCCEDDSPWSLPMREKLHGKLVQYVKDCGRDLERSGLHDQAIRVYLRGLEVDDLVEEFYRGLIMSSIALGQNGDAALAYRRCQKVLSARLGVEPSPETRSLYLDMQRQVEPRRDDIRSSARS